MDSEEGLNLRCFFGTSREFNSFYKQTQVGHVLEIEGGKDINNGTFEVINMDCGEILARRIDGNDEDKKPREWKVSDDNPDRYSDTKVGDILEIYRGQQVEVIRVEEKQIIVKEV